MVVVETSLIYGILMGREWNGRIGVVINTRMAIITFNHNNDLIILPREGNFKDNVLYKEGKEDFSLYEPMGMGTYMMFT